MSDYKQLTNDELNEDMEFFCSIACCKSESKWACDEYRRLLQTGMDATKAYYSIVSTIKEH